MINGGISIKGSYHDVNQDYFICKPYDNGYIMVVSDGIGSKKLSQYGSKAICETIYDMISKKLVNYELLSFKDVLFSCHDEWKKRLNEYDLSQCYATMLVAVVCENTIKAARLGDGFIGIYTDKGVVCLFDEKEDYFANETDCLCEYFEREKLETVEIEYDSLWGIVSCTDGIEIGTMQEDQLISFTRDFVDEYKQYNRKIIVESVEEWLLDWPGRDDKTIAFLMKGEN